MVARRGLPEGLALRGETLPQVCRGGFGAGQGRCRLRAPGCPASVVQVWRAASGMWLMACSVSAVIVRLGFTPRFALSTEPSQMYRLR